MLVVTLRLQVLVNTRLHEKIMCRLSGVCDILFEEFSEILFIVSKSPPNGSLDHFTLTLQDVKHGGYS